MPERDPREKQMWEAGWEGHAEAQRARIARLPLVEKLRWLEEAQAIIVHLRRGPGPKPGHRRPSRPRG
jgi:hypothetical protein